MIKTVNKNGVIFVRRSDDNEKKYIVKCPICHKECETWKSHFYRGSNPCKEHIHDKRLYSIYTNMKTRCYNPNATGYEIYGGRGITVCDEWLNDFQSFYDWAISHGYAVDLTLDRVDVNGNYCPSNCRWADKITQGNNKRNNVLFDVLGEPLSFRRICEKLGINYKTEHTYYTRHGYDKERERLKTYIELLELESEKHGKS